MNLDEGSLDRRSTTSVLRASVGAAPPAVIGLLILLICAWVFRPVLLSPLLLLAIFKQAATLGVITIGQALVMRCRSIDLSASGIVLATVYIVTSGFLPFSTPVVAVIALLAGACVGALNGFVITRLRASAVIVTLATATILTGIVIALSEIRQPGSTPEFIRYFGLGRIAGIPLAALVWLAVLVPAAVILRVTVFGRFLDAVGANPKAAAISGVPNLQIVFLCHVVSGLMAALSGLLFLASSSDGNMSLGQGVVLNSVAAVVLGGVTFGGGKGRLYGPALGAFMITFLYSFLTSFGLGSAGQAMVQGSIIAAAAALDGIRKR